MAKGHRGLEIVEGNFTPGDDKRKTRREGRVFVETR
jgi:hypothetical protein